MKPNFFFKFNSTINCCSNLTIGLRLKCLKTFVCIKEQEQVNGRKEGSKVEVCEKFSFLQHTLSAHCHAKVDKLFLFMHPKIFQHVETMFVFEPKIVFWRRKYFKLFLCHPSFSSAAGVKIKGLMAILKRLGHKNTGESEVNFSRKWCNYYHHKLRTEKID